MRFSAVSSFFAPGALVAAGLACVLPPLSPAQAAEALHRPNDGEPDSLDPQKTTSLYALGLDRDMFMGLIMLDAHAQPAPGLAESWDVSDDKKIWTFHLRHDAKWSNGDPVTADDFIYSFRRLVDPKTAAGDPSDLKQVVNFEAIVSGQEKDLTKLGVEAPDQYTVKLTLTEPRIVLPLLLTDPYMAALPRAVIEKWGEQWTRPEHIVASGPYMMKDWVPQSEVVLTKNPNFFDAATVKIEEVHWIEASDREAALKRYRGGELDWVGLTKTSLPWARANLPDQLHIGADNQIGFMPINLVKGPLAQDIRLREALNLAIDREILVTKLDPRGELPAYSLTPPVISNYTPQDMPLKEMTQADRTKRAKELVAAAGYSPDHPLKLTVSYPTQETTRQILLGIRAMLQPVGIEITLDNMEWQSYVGLIKNATYDLGYMGASGNYDDYESGLDNYRSDSGDYNWSHFKNPKFDDLFHRGGTATDMATRRELMQEAERTALADYPVVPLEYGVIDRLVNPKLVGVPDTEQMPQSRYLSFK
jgi:oligopeptide transport system substrate-binding protein